MSEYEKVLSRLAFHAVYDSSIADAVKYAAANGFSGVQVDLGVPTFSTRDIGKGARQMLADLAKEEGIRLLYHAPYDCSLFIWHETLKNGWLGYLRECIDLVADTGGTTLVLHPETFPSFRKAGEKFCSYQSENAHLYARMLRENLTELLYHAGGRVILSLENYIFDRYTIPAVRGLLDTTPLTLCLDVAKLYDRRITIRDHSEVDLYALNRHRVSVIHIHDFVKGMGPNQVIGTGDIDFATHLHEFTGFDIDYVIEVRPREAALESKINLEKMLRVDDAGS